MSSFEREGRQKPWCEKKKCAMRANEEGSLPVPDILRAVPDQFRNEGGYSMLAESARLAEIEQWQRQKLQLLSSRKSLEVKFWEETRGSAVQLLI